MFFIAMAGSGQGGQSKDGPMGMLVMFAMIFAVMYFLMIRPQSKKQKEHKTMLESMKQGDKVITAGGLYGTIAGIREKDGVIILKIADNVKIEIAKSSIARILSVEEGKKK